MRMTALVVLLVVLAQGVRAEPEETPLQQAIRKDPAGFQAMAEDVIAGFAGPRGLTAAGIEEHVALERAFARAGAMRRLLAMDLDNDGAIDRGELAVVQRAASATARGRLERQFTAADSDGDGRIGVQEIRAEGQAAALRALTEAEAETLRAMISLETDGDGALTLEELRAALSWLNIAPAENAT
jgi:Ca2+-binding EF-hand superfamily protein